MKLTAIEAIRVGALENTCVAGIGDGLTVVLGPNESGKSTLTATTRHVLYGFPTKTKADAYLTASGGRHARLVFASEAGEWALERTDGTKGGPLSVITRRGPARPDLRDELTRGVSEDTYRVVFGFGLDELNKIRDRNNEQIAAYLYDAEFGVPVNPIEVRSALGEMGSELFGGSRAKNPELNRLTVEIKELRDRIAELEGESAALAAEELRLQAVSEELAPLRQQRDELENKVALLRAQADRLEDWNRQLAGLRPRMADLEAKVADIETSIGFIRPNEAVLAQAPSLESLLEDASAFRRRIESIDEFELEARRLGEAAKRASSAAQDVTVTPETKAAVEGWRLKLSDLARESEACGRDAEQKRVYAEEAARVAGSAAAPRRNLVPALALLAVAAVAIVAGVALQQLVAAGVGALVLALALVLLAQRPAGQSGEMTAEAARLEAAAEAADKIAAAASGKLIQERANWTAWLREQRLDGYGQDPAAVLGLLDEIRSRDELLAQREQVLTRAGAEREHAQAWALRLVEVVASYDPSASQLSDLNATLDLASKTRARLAEAKSAQAERDALAAEKQKADVELASLRRQHDELSGLVGKVAQETGASPDSALQTLQGELARSADDLQELKVRCEHLVAEEASLKARLGQDARENELAAAYQRMQGLRAQAERAAERYLVIALASKLIDAARERFESARQPEVIRQAGRVFREITEGRYERIHVPLDGGDITVFDAAGNARRPGELSRGTAEQLYVALRVGLIASYTESGRHLPVLMDDVVVNFDPERRAGAVKAVGELSRLRQVIYFTCHPETAELLTSTVTGATLVQLDRCSI